MSLFGAMFTGVSGLNAQSNKISVISDNIANVNTVGYKRADAQFESLVIGSGNSRSSSSGGVLTNTRHLVDEQGLLVNTNAATDLAISGKGFLIVRENSTSTPVYTRAGSFRTDKDGNLQNAQGFLLQGWPLDAQGRLPGDPGNINTTASSTFDSLKNVNITGAGGKALPTTSIAVSANLNAGEKVFAGSGFTANMDSLSVLNDGIGADAIIAPAEYGIATTNSIARGDQITIATGGGVTNNFTYGGFTVGRNVTIAGSLGNGDNGTTIAPTTLTGGEVSFVNGSATVTVTTAGNHNLQTGAIVTLAGLATTAGVPAGQLNVPHTVTVTGPNTFTFNVTTPASSTASNAAGGTISTRQFAGNVLDAFTSTQAFLGTTGVSQFSPEGLTFTITSNTAGVKTFNYVTGSPNTAAGQFNSLATLAQAIGEVSGLNGRVVNGRLLVSSEDANQAITFANGDLDGTSGPPPKQGIDWVNELGLANVANGSGRFNTLRGLYKAVQDAPGISASLESDLSNSQLGIHVDNPLDTLTVQDYIQVPATSLASNPLTASGAGPSYTISVADPSQSFSVGNKVVMSGVAAFNGFSASELNGTVTVASVTPGVGFTYTVTPVGPVTLGSGGGASATRAATNSGSLVAELGLGTSLNGAAYTPQTTGSIGPKYDASGSSGQNMASGDINPQFSRQVRVYDSLGTGHDVRLGFLKVDDNRWAVEAYMVPKEDVNSTLSDGQIATGFLTFNGDGTLRSISSQLANPIDISWTTGSTPSQFKVDWGTAGSAFGTLGAATIGQSDGMRQFDEDYNVNYVNQDGAPSGYLVSVEIDKVGKVVASYSNGKTQALYQLPIADFANPNGLRSLSGNIFTATQDAGDVNMRIAATGGIGELQSGALESSNVDLASELTDMIVAQRAYQSNTRVISTADQLLQSLAQLGQ